MQKKDLKMITNYNIKLDKLCIFLGLGKLTSEPEQIIGGHLHRVFSVNTVKGKYAVKALNPHILNLDDAKQNLLNSEYIAAIASKTISCANAKVFNDILMPEINGQFYFIYDWISGKTLHDDEINIEKCRKMGTILSDIHNIDFSSLKLIDKDYRTEKLVDWNSFLLKGKEKNSAWVDIYEKNVDMLYNWNTRLIAAAEKLQQHIIISHRDLEPKNVMWVDDEPIIIDWEAAGFIHPMHDLIESGIYWSCNSSGFIEKHKFMAFIDGYKSKNGQLNADWQVVLEKGYGAKLGWLEYSLKRSLGIIIIDESDEKMGTEQVMNTIKVLHNYTNVINNITEWLME